jgi:hypothetical protein
MVWTEVVPDFWKPAKSGDELEGVLIERELESGSNKSKLYHVQVTSDNIIRTKLVWGCTVLDNRMAGVPIGTQVKIVFVGKDKTKTGKPLNLYKVYVQ